MSKSNRYSPEVRERAVRLVQEARKEHPSQWAAIESIAPKIGCAAQTLHDWVKRHEVDTGRRDGITTDERERMKALERRTRSSVRPTKFCGWPVRFSRRRSSTASRRSEGIY